MPRRNGPSAEAAADEVAAFIAEDDDVDCAASQSGISVKPSKFVMATLDEALHCGDGKNTK